MAYCDLADVTERLPKMTISATSSPSTADVTAWCSHVSDSIIDPEIRTVITLPVTDSSGLAYLKEMAILWCVAEFYRSQRMESDYAANYQGQFNKMLDRIMKNPSVLAPPQSYASKPASSTRLQSEYKRGEAAW